MSRVVPAAIGPARPRRRGKSARRRAKTAIGVVLTAIMLFPVYWMINVSFTSDQNLRRNPPNLFPVDGTLAGYRAVLSQVKALRAGHPLGWREEALDGLARLAVMPTPRRDLVALRTEAVAAFRSVSAARSAASAASIGAVTRCATIQGPHWAAAVRVKTGLPRRVAVRRMTVRSLARTAGAAITRVRATVARPISRLLAR